MDDASKARKQQVITQLCKMITRVWQHLDPQAHNACECICKDTHDFRGSPEVLDFIEKAVSYAIERKQEEIEEYIEASLGFLGWRGSLNPHTAVPFMRWFNRLRRLEPKKVAEIEKELSESHEELDKELRATDPPKYEEWALLEANSILHAARFPPTKNKDLRNMIARTIQDTASGYGHMKNRLHQIITVMEAGTPAEQGYSVVGRLAWNALLPDASVLQDTDGKLIAGCEAAMRGKSLCKYCSCEIHLDTDCCVSCADEKGP